MNEKNLSVITALDYKTLNAGRLLKENKNISSGQPTRFAPHRRTAKPAVRVQGPGLGGTSLA